MLKARKKVRKRCQGLQRVWNQVAVEDTMMVEKKKLQKRKLKSKPYPRLPKKAVRIKINKCSTARKKMQYVIPVLYTNLLGSVSISTMTGLLIERALSTANGKSPGSVTFMPVPPQFSAYSAKSQL